MPQDAVKVSSSALHTLLDLEPTKSIDKSKTPDDVSFLSRFSPAELRARLKDIFVPSEYSHRSTTAPGIISYLNPIHRDVGKVKLDVEKMKALAPELEQSRILVSSSIMSPNDLQDGEFTFLFEDIPGVSDDEDLVKAVTDVYDQHFNRTLKWNLKAYDWIGDIQYKEGAKPILILPQATQDEIRSRTAHDINKDKNVPYDGYMFGPGTASFFEVQGKNYYKDDLSDYFYSEKVLTWKDVLNNQSPSKYIEDMVPAMESFNVIKPTIFKTDEEKVSVNEASFGKDYIAGMESMIVNFRKKLEEGDVIKVTENPEVIKFATHHSLKSKDEMYKKIQEKYKLGMKRYPMEEGVMLKPNPEGFTHHDHPTVMELPVESVIPIFVPGCPSEHLGYFILLDQYGRPLTIENSGLAHENNCNGGSCNPGTPTAAYEAIFGNGCLRSMTSKNNLGAASSMIFHTFLDKYLRARIKGVLGRDDLTISRFNALSTVMFQRLMEQKKTMILYAPTSLLHYFAFAYRDSNGAGVSKCEDIMFILSLRTTFLVASMIAMATDAVNQKVIEIGVDEKEANLEGVMDLIGNIFIERSKLNGSIDPTEIMKDIYANNLTIVPKNIPGLQDLSVEVQPGNSQTTRPDDTLLEKLSDLLVSHLDVPPAALSQMSDPEFARSLTTYNLFFAKKIVRYQNIFCGQMSECVKDYTFFSPPFQTAIRKIVSANVGKRQKLEMPKSGEKLKDKNTNKYQRDIDKLVMDILSNVKVKLPKPNIVVDKTQFEEIRNYLSNLNEIADQLFNNELISTDDQAATNAVTIAKAFWRRKQLLDFITKVGKFEMVEIPDPDNIDHEEIINYVQAFQNLNAHIEQHRNNIGVVGMSDVNNQGFGSDSGGFGDESGFGSDESSDMSGMDDMGSTDMGNEESQSEDLGMPAESESAETNDEEGSTASMYHKLYRPKKK